MKNLLSKIGAVLFFIGGCGLDSNFVLSAGMIIIGTGMITVEVCHGTGKEI